MMNMLALDALSLALSLMVSDVCRMMSRVLCSKIRVHESRSQQLCQRKRGARLSNIRHSLQKSRQGLSD